MSLFFNTLVRSHIKYAANREIEIIPRKNAARCHDEPNSKLRRCIGSGMKRALKITIGTSRKAMRENTAQILPIFCLDPDSDDLKIK